MVGFALALLLSALGGALLIQLGHESGFVDKPDGFLKSHEWPAVPLGGVAIFFGVHAGMAVEGLFDEGLFLASGIVLVLGLIDDRRDLAPILRLFVEFIAGVVLVVVADLPALGDGPLGVILGVVLVVVAINAVNMFDGLDGLAGSAGLVAAAGTIGLAASRGLGLRPGFVLAAALLGFLLWNWHPARMFLGDNGAYSVAVFLVYGFIAASPEGSDAAVLIGFGLMGVYAIDLAMTLLRRKLAGKPLFPGDRSHVYDQLSDRGWSVTRVVGTAAVAQALIGVLVIGVDAAFKPGTAIAVLVVVFVAALAGLSLAGFARPDEAEATS
ncbi:MAG TPA: MraY family glycosyltransferase [Acidimicrobiia bacterium]|nr:MraY family glycosyltransferase [Acidimicrobiia bacterium]